MYAFFQKRLEILVRSIDVGAVMRNNRRGGMLQNLCKVLCVCLCAAVIDVVAVCISRFVMTGQIGMIYLQMVFLPLAAFVSGFFTLVMTRVTGFCILVPLLVHLIAYGLVLGFSFGMFLWGLLYLISGFMGLGIAYIAMTHRRR